MKNAECGMRGKLRVESSNKMQSAECGTSGALIFLYKVHAARGAFAGAVLHDVRVHRTIIEMGSNRFGRCAWS